MSRMIRIAVSIALCVTTCVASAILTAEQAGKIEGVIALLKDPAFKFSEELVSAIVTHCIAIDSATSHDCDSSYNFDFKKYAIYSAIWHVEHRKSRGCSIKTYIQQRIEKGLPVDDFAWCATKVSKIRTLVAQQSKQAHVPVHADRLVKRRKKTSSMMQKRGTYSYAQPLKQDPSGEGARKTRRDHRAKSHG